MPATVTCPYCKGEIDADALKCRHCGEWVSSEAGEEAVKLKAQRRADFIWDVQTAHGKKAGQELEGCVKWVVIIAAALVGLVYISMIGK